MKYIRTKDGILIAPELYDNGGRVLMSDPPMYETRNAKNEWGCIDCDKVIKIADTIEELCDEFVMLRLKDELNDNEPIIFKHLDLAKSYFEKYLGYAIYAAIWADKGLIYVAKMNEKGELELL